MDSGRISLGVCLISLGSLWVVAQDDERPEALFKLMSPSSGRSHSDNCWDSPCDTCPTWSDGAACQRATVAGTTATVSAVARRVQPLDCSFGSPLLADREDLIEGSGLLQLGESSPECRTCVVVWIV